MAAHCFFDCKEDIDPARMEEYRQGVLATVHHYGGQYVVVNGGCDVVDPERTQKCRVIIRFASLQRAQAWYQAEQHKHVKSIGFSASKCDTVCDAVFMKSEPRRFVTPD